MALQEDPKGMGQCKGNAMVDHLQDCYVVHKQIRIKDFKRIADVSLCRMQGRKKLRAKIVSVNLLETRLVGK